MIRDLMDLLGENCMLNVQFELGFENGIRLKENVVYGNEVVVHSNEAEIRRYENVFHKSEKNSCMNEIEFHSYEVVLKENKIDYWI